MKETYLVDTNVVLEDPNFYSQLPLSDIIISSLILVELDKLKSERNILGKNARDFLRFLNTCFDKGDISKGFELKCGSTLHMHDASESLLSNTNVDSALIEYARDLNASGKYKKLTLLTNDLNMRLRAKVVGVDTESYDERTRQIDFYQGYTVEDCFDDVDIDDFYKEKEIELEDCEDLSPNEFIHLQSEDNPKKSALGVYVGEGRIKKIKSFSKGVFGIEPRNLKQHFALHALMDPNIHLVILAGPAGTGKTLLACAAGMHQALAEKKFNQVMVSRPIISMGQDMGYLPGDISEKMDPWLKPIYDSMSFLMGSTNDNKGKAAKDLIENGKLAIEPLSYIRGRSIPNQFLLIDEAQNLTPHELKTIITRAGKGTKIVLTGDPYQIDTPKLNKHNNGLIHTINRFRDQRIAASIFLDKTERSELASVAAKVL